jgi:hypothetical protein
MLSFKKILITLFIATTLGGCMEQKILFSFEQDLNNSFFKEIPGLGGEKYFGWPITRKATEAEIYTSSFREQFVEKDNLLELSELNDAGQTQPAAYLEANGYSQNLHLLKYNFIYTVTQNGKSFDVPVEAVVFFSIKHNNNDDVLGITSPYFGIINREDNLISFDTELSLKKLDKQYYLKMPPGKPKNMNGLLFLPANFVEHPVESETKLNIEKIVKLNANKVGGYKPLVFNIAEIFRDKTALQFHYDSTLHLNHK